MCKWLILSVLVSVIGVQGQYEPTWESLDARPLPSWYDEAKFGIFIHWGVFSVPSFGSEWFWEFWQGRNTSQYVDFMKNNYPPDFTYGDFAAQFSAEFYNPNNWADLFKKSGAKYIVLTSKHHEGYTLWPSKHSFNWNAMDVGPRRDLVGELASAIRNRTDLHFGLYHSLFEWFNPLWLSDKENNFTTREFVATKSMPELYEIVEQYQPEVVWSDGDAEADEAYWGSREFLAWLYNESPVKDTVVTNDRWGYNVSCHHGGYYTCNDRYNPGTLQPRKWENCMTIDQRSWGFRRNAPLSDYLSIEDLLKTFVSTVSCGGNLLMNVGPTKDGMIVPIFEERLQQMGEWLSVNGEAIYGSKPWNYQNDTLTPDVWYTSKDDAVYALVLFWPTGRTLQLGAVTAGFDLNVTMLGYDGQLQWKPTKSGVQIVFPPMAEVQSKWSWVLKLIGLSNKYHGKKLKKYILDEA